MRIRPDVVKKRDSKLPVKVLNKTVLQLGGDQNCVNVTLHKTVRIPDGDGKVYPLPPSLGLLSVYKVDDYRDTVPKEWLKRGGVFFCMHQREAMWMKFDNVGGPHAMKVGIGKINAVSGEKWKPKLTGGKKADYLNVPKQKWLDGIASNKNHIKQFVAMPLGSGYTVESQMTGKDENGGIQILSYNQKKRYHVPPPRRTPPIFMPHPTPFPYPAPVVPMNPWGISTTSSTFGYAPVQMSAPMMVKEKCAKRRRRNVYQTQQSMFCCESDGDDFGGGAAQEMGLGAGGKMKQKVFADSYGIGSWDQNKCAKIFIHIVNSEMFEQITGKKCEDSKITKRTYQTYGYPWFDYYEEKYSKGIGGSSKFDKIRSVKEIDNGYANFGGYGNYPYPPVYYENDSVRDGEW